MDAFLAILSMAPVSFEKTPERLDLADLLAPDSKKSHELVKDTVKETMTLYISLLEGKSVVRIGSWHSTMFRWELYNKRNSMRLELEDLEPRTINGTSILESNAPIVFYQKNKGEYASVSSGTEQVLQIAQFLADFFEISVQNLHIEHHHLDYLDSILSCDMIKMNQLKYVVIGPGVVSHSELTQILEGFGDQALELFNLNTQNGSVYDKVISFQKLNVHTANWFTGAMLMNVDCEYVYLTNCELENEDVNRFLLQLMNGSFENLKTIHIGKSRILSRNLDNFEENWDVKSFDMDEITQGLDEFYEEHAGFDAETRRRFKRTDGTFVNVEIDIDEDYEKWVFVWKGLTDKDAIMWMG